MEQKLNANSYEEEKCDFSFKPFNSSLMADIKTSIKYKIKKHCTTSATVYKKNTFKLKKYKKIKRLRMCVSDKQMKQYNSYPV